MTPRSECSSRARTRTNSTFQFYFFKFQDSFFQFYKAIRKSRNTFSRRSTSNGCILHTPIVCWLASQDVVTGRPREFPPTVFEKYHRTKEGRKEGREGWKFGSAWTKLLFYSGNFTHFLLARTHRCISLVAALCSSLRLGRLLHPSPRSTRLRMYACVQGVSRKM